MNVDAHETPLVDVTAEAGVIAKVLLRLTPERRLAAIARAEVLLERYGEVFLKLDLERYGKYASLADRLK
jgi:hypothetical protein